MNWVALLAGIGAGALVGSPFSWLVLIWLYYRKVIKPVAALAPLLPGSGLRLVKDGDEHGSAS